MIRQQALDYLLFLPRDRDPKREQGYPLILVLHGPPKQAAKDPDVPRIVVSPRCPEGDT